MSNELIRTAFDRRLSAWAATRNLQIAYDNQVYEPQQGETYLRSFLLPAATDSEDLAGESLTFLGSYQVNVVAPAGGGPRPAGKLAEAVAALFPLYEPLSADGLDVYVIRPAWAGTAIQDDTSYTVPVTVPYRSDTFTPRT